MNNVNQLINIILTTFIFYYLVNEVFKIDLFNMNNVETLTTDNNANKKSGKTNTDKQELVDMINEIEDDKSDELINADYTKYIKSEDLNIGDLLKSEQIYTQQVNECELTSTDLIDENIEMATISNDDKSYTMNGFNELDAFDNSNSYSLLK